MKTVGAIIVTYNRKELLKECLDALLNISYENLKIFIIDNFSTDNTREYIKDYLNIDNVKYFNTGKNLGGAGGFNFGLKQAYKDGCNYLWLMDDDCIVSNDTLEAFLKVAKEKDDDFGFLSSKVLWKDESLCKMNIQRITKWKYVKDFDKEQEIQYASFVSLFLTSKVVKEFGLPYKDFFIWSDDWEYTRRISKKLKSYYIPTSVVHHLCQNNVGANIMSASKDRIERFKYLYRNDVVLYRLDGFDGWLFMKIRILMHKLKIIKKGEEVKEKFNIINSAIKEGKRFYPELEMAYKNDQKIDVLVFFAEPLAYGGQEAFEINMYSSFENDNIRYTFVTPFESVNETLISLASKRGDKIISYNYEFESKKRKQYIKKALNACLKENKFDVIHIQSGSLWALYNASKIAKKNKINKIIVHSHCAGSINLKYKLIKFFSDRGIEKNANSFLACSDLAAKWKFPKHVIDTKNYYILKNGIDTNKFTFDENIRKEYRKEFNLEDKFVILNVGRFSIQKNQKFLLTLAKELLKENITDFKFLIVGAGELKEEFIREMRESSLNDYFLILEKRSDIPSLMMASDMFVLPSLFEGLAVCSIESQASGLKTICSDLITEETKMTDLISFTSLDDTSLWIKQIKEIKNSNDYDRKKYSNIIKECGYDCKESSHILEQIYTNDFIK